MADGGAPGIPAASISKFGGLYRSVDPFAIAPGAMEVADNIVIPGPSLVMPRRGFNALVNTGVDWAAIGAFTSFVMAQSAPDTPIGATNGLFWASPVTGLYNEVTRALSDFFLTPALLGPYGSNLPATQAKTRFLNANANFYSTTNFGLARVTSPQGTWVPAGLPTALTPTADQAVGTGINDGTQVAYRQTYKYTDANGNEHTGPPSQRAFYSNASGSAKAVQISWVIPELVPVDAKVQTWRTLATPNSTLYPDVAGDEMFLVDERPIGGGFTGVDAFGYANGIMTITDTTPSIPWLVDPLYTNPTTGDINGLGIANANTSPPVCADTFEFKGRTYFANTEGVQTLTAQILGVGAGSTAAVGGIQDNDQVVVGNLKFQFIDNVGTYLTHVFIAGGFFTLKLWRTGGTFDKGTINDNVNATALELATYININGNAGQSIASQLWSAPALTPNGVPGILTISRYIPGATSFSLTAGVGAGRGWAGLLTANNASDSNRQPSNLMQSHDNDPESVPVAFTNTVGRAELPILRGISLRDSVFLFKGGGDGLWRMVDDGTGTLQITPMDPTVNLVAPETAVALDNTVFCLSDKGVLRITDGGAPENLSESKIQEDLEALMRYVGPATLARLAFGVAYESARLYVLALPEAPNSIACTIQYVYNLQTDSWTRWTLPAVACGFAPVAAGDQLIFGLRPHGQIALPQGGRTLWFERKALDHTDWQDPGFTDVWGGTGSYSASNFPGNRAGGPTGYAPGDLIQYTHTTTSTLARVLSAVWNVGSNQTLVTFDRVIGITASEPFLVLKGIQSHVEFLPFPDGEPLYEKQWQNTYWFFRYENVDRFQVAFSTEKQATPQAYTLLGAEEKAYLWSETLGFGLDAWGSAAWNHILRLSVDQAASRSAALTLSLSAGDALAHWELSAIRIPYDPASFRVVR